jgi:acyl-CoA synthetase (AMP-forming)/AMP-acid ligase II
LSEPAAAGPALTGARPLPTELTSLLFEPVRPIEPDEVVLRLDERAVTHAELVTSATALAALLEAGSLPRGARVGVMLPNRPETVAAWFGIWRRGATVVLCNPRLPRDELARIGAELRLAAIVTDADHAADARTVAPVISVASLQWTADPGPYGPPEIPPGADPKVAIIQFTSGTTGAPKPVPLRHAALLKMMGGILQTLGGDKRDQARPMPNLIPVSLSLNSGIYNVLFAFAAGAAAILMDHFEPVAFARLVDRYQIRSVVLPPPAMAMLADEEAVTTLAPLRYVRSMSAPLPPATARRFFDRFGVAILNGYGQSELGGEIVGWSAADWREHGADKLGAVGRPHPGVELRILSPDGEAVPVEGEGEIWCRTPAMRDGLVDPAPIRDRMDADGWFRTGDIGHLDPEGFLWIDGRVSDMINRGGLKVSPGEVEDALRGAPGVRDVAVVGVNDPRVGEVPWAFVVPVDPAAPPDAAALRDHCRQHLVAYKVPAHVEFVADLPRTETGKVQPGPLRELAAKVSGISS